MINHRSATIEPQMQLSQLFMAAAERKNHELPHGSVEGIERLRSVEIEPKGEEPERWDGLL